MDHYHLWCDLRPDVSDVEFAEAVADYLDRLKHDGRLVDWSLARRKLGLGHPALGEFHVLLTFEGLAQIDQAFQAVGTRSGEIEGLHHAVNSKVTGLVAALYRDFPDAFRARGEECF